MKHIVLSAMLLCFALGAAAQSSLFQTNLVASYGTTHVYRFIDTDLDQVCYGTASMYKASDQPGALFCAPIEGTRYYPAKK